MDAVKGKKILLVGNPNVGKSVIFSYLTGKYAIVSNYPGTTVEVSEGRMSGWHEGEVIDTPGINSLFPASEDERVTRDILRDNPDAVVVQVADAKNIDRALTLTTQLAEAGRKMILVLNMMDEARQRGIGIDSSRLSSLLGVEVIETVAVEKRGLSKLSTVIGSQKARVPQVSIDYPGAVRDAIEKVEKELSGAGGLGLLGSLTLVTGDRGIFQAAGVRTAELVAKVAGDLKASEEKLSNPFAYYIARTRGKAVDSIIRRTVKRSGADSKSSGMRGPVVFALAAIAVAAVALHLIFPMQVITGAGLFPSLEIVFVMILATALAGPEKTERFVLDPATGIITLLSVIFVIYQLVGVFAAGTLVGLLEKDVFSAFVVPAVARLSGTGFFRDLLVGDYGLVSMGLAYAVSIVLPIMTVFFLVFGILEDTGYFPRLTAFTNRVFRLIGVNGKATLPIVLGFGCVTMAVLSSRILETRKERLIVVFLLALAVPCSAQLGIMMALMSAISIKAIVLIALIVIGQFFIFGRILVRLIGGSVSDFMMELPPMRVPRLANIARKTGARAMWFLREALPYFMVATLILFALDRTGGMQFIYKAAGPIASKILGLPVETAPVFILGFFRRDYGAAGLYRLWQSGMLTGNQIVISLVVMSLFLPCLATLIVIVKELGMRWALTIMLFVMSVSLLTGGILNLVLNLSGVTF